MSVDSLFSRWGRAATRILRIVARPVRVAQGEHGVVMKANRGYGSRAEIFMIGRVFRQSPPNRDARGDSLIHQLRDIGRRISRRAVPGAGFCRNSGSETIKDQVLVAGSCGEQIELLRE